MTDIIIQEVIEHCRVTIQQLRSDNRAQALVKARHLIFYFMREYTTLSTTEIGAFLFRDHATVIHGSKSVKNQLRLYWDFRKEILPLESRIKELMQSHIAVNEEVYMENDFYTN